MSHYKILRVEPELLIEALCGDLKIKTDPPLNKVQVKSVGHSLDRNTIDFLLYHPDFPIVPMGEFAPNIDFSLTYDKTYTITVEDFLTTAVGNLPIWVQDLMMGGKLYVHPSGRVVFDDTFITKHISQNSYGTFAE